MIKRAIYPQQSSSARERAHLMLRKLFKSKPPYVTPTPKLHKLKLIRVAPHPQEILHNLIPSTTPQPRRKILLQILLLLPFTPLFCNVFHILFTLSDTPKKVKNDTEKPPLPLWLKKSSEFALFKLPKNSTLPNNHNLKPPFTNFFCIYAV